MMNPNDLELRYYSAENLRADAQGEFPATIRGYASVFDSLSVVLWGFREKVSAGAFAETIENDDIRALWNHNVDHVLGRNRSGTLALWEDPIGLGFEVTPPETQAGRDAVETIRRGDVDQVSFGFLALDDEWNETDDGEIVRTIKRARLYEISPVTFPAYQATTVSVRGDGQMASMFGRKIAIPAEFRRASDSAADAAATARARWARRNRQIEIMTQE